MNKFLLIVLFAGLLFSPSVVAEDYPVKVINGKKYYEYVVQKGEGAWGICRRFSVSQDELYGVNPSLEDGLKAGDVILIPINEKETVTETITTKAVTETRSLITHEVKRRETLYSLSKQYGVAIHDLIALNPEIENGLKIGMVLTIPDAKAPVTASVQEKNPNPAPAQNIGEEKKATAVKDDVTHEVKKRETLFNISKRYNVSISDLIKRNPELENGLKEGMIIVIPVEDKDKANVLVKSAIKTTPDVKPEMSETSGKPQTETVSQTEVFGWRSPYTDIRTDFTRAERVRVAILLPFMSNMPVVEKGTERFIEFYKGALLAMEHAKRRGISLDVVTFDTKKDQHTMDSILKLPELSEVDVIIGPAYSDHVSPVVSFAKKRGIVCMVPFSSNVPDILRYDKMIQFNPAQDELFDRVLENTIDTLKMKYVIGHIQGAKNKGSNFAAAMKTKLEEAEISFSELDVTPENIDTLLSLSQSDSILFLPASTSIEDVSAILDSIAGFNSPNIFVWGFEEWKAFVRACPKTYYYSLFNPRADNDYITAYTKWFGTRKKSDEWQYDLIGYDIVTLIVNTSEIGPDGKIRLGLEYAPNDAYLQSKMKFEKRLHGGYVNMNYNIFFYDGEMVRIVEKE